MTIRFNPNFRLPALAIAVLMATGAAWAEKPDGPGHGNDKKEQKQAQKEVKREQKEDKKEAKQFQKDQKQAQKAHREDVKVGAFFNDDHRRLARAYYVQQYPQGRRCPPGLAKKNNGCMPPGQARYVVGKPLPRDVRWYAVPQPVIVQLPVAPYGYRYVRVGNDIVLMSAQTSLVVDVIQGLLGG